MDGLSLIILSEINQTKAYYMISHIYGILKTNTTTKLTEKEIRLMVTVGGRWGKWRLEDGSLKV